jgi:hypothetical protein
MSFRSPSTRDLRASDADRERVLAVLSSAYSDGRITADEFAQRSDLAVAAKTFGDLATLTDDLLTTPLVQLDGSRSISGIFSPAQRGGRWVVPETLTVTAVRSTVEVDFREAILQASQVRVNVTIFVGNVYLIIPDGIRVEMAGRAILGGYRATGRNASGPAVAVADPDAPALYVHALVVGGKLVVRTPPKRRRLFGRRA